MEVTSTLSDLWDVLDETYPLLIGCIKKDIQNLQAFRRYNFREYFFFMEIMKEGYWLEYDEKPTDPQLFDYSQSQMDHAFNKFGLDPIGFLEKYGSLEDIEWYRAGQYSENQYNTRGMYS